MKNILFLVLLLFASIQAKADQVAYVSRAEAMAAAEAIQHAGVVYSYCGCCSDDTPKKLKVEKIIVRAVGAENLYRVIVVVKGTEFSLDLAYTWLKVENIYYTVAQAVGIEHDPCNRIPK